MPGKLNYLKLLTASISLSLLCTTNTPAQLTQEQSASQPVTQTTGNTENLDSQLSDQATETHTVDQPVDNSRTTKNVSLVMTRLAPAKTTQLDSMLPSIKLDESYWSSLPKDLNPRGEIAEFTPGLSAPVLPSEQAFDTSSLSKLTSIFPSTKPNMVSSTSGLLNGYIESSTEEPVIIDNDEAQTVETTIEYKDLPTDEKQTHVKIGAQFPVILISEISSKTAKNGDLIQARLKYDLKIGDKLIACNGAIVNGHINYCLRARSAMHSLVSPERWYRNSGCLGITFDEMINDKGEHIPLVAAPTRKARIIRNKGEGRELGVNHHGQITGPWAQQLRYKAIRIGLNAALAPAGVFSFGAMPVALGLIGAANPSFAFMKPVGLNVRHRRIKGFAWGLLSGVPGSWIVEDTVIKGQEAIIKPGDEFLAEFQQEFTGQPASEAELLSSATTKVHGQVMSNQKR